MIGLREGFRTGMRIDLYETFNFVVAGFVVSCPFTAFISLCFTLTYLVYVTMTWQFFCRLP